MSLLFDPSLFKIPGFSTAFLHGVMGVLTILLSITFFISYKINKNIVSKKLTLFFLFFTLYSLCVTTSIIVFPGNMVVAGWGIIIGLYFILLVILMGFDTPLFYKHFLFEKNAGRIRLVFAMLWGFFSVFGILFAQLPFVGAGNFVYWNLTPLCGWGYLYMSGTHYVNKDQLEAYIKTRIFAIDGVLWSIAGPSYIIAPGFWAITMAFTIMITTFLSTAIVFTYFRFKNTGGILNSN